MLGILAQLVPEGRREKAKMRGHDVFITDSGDGLKSAAAFFRGLEVFIWITQGKDASKELRQIASGFEFKNL